MSNTFTLNDLELLINYAKLRNNSKSDYFLFQKYQGELLVKFLSNKDIKISGKELLDLGCGFGGYSKAFLDAGAKVIGFDLSPIKGHNDILMISGDALSLPFENESFDVVISASLIEHVSQPLLLINEANRVLKSGGILYLSFPPFYSPVWGHQFSPYHLLGERIALLLSQKFNFYRPSPWIKDSSKAGKVNYKAAYGKWGLYPMTIKKFCNMVKNFPLNIICQSTRYSPINFSRIPIIGEFLTLHVQFILKKQ